MKYSSTCILAKNSELSPNLLIGGYRLSIEFYRYFIASIVALFTDFFIYSTLVSWFSWHYLSAACIGFIAGVVTIYFLSVAWVFRRRKIKNSKFEFLIFCTIGILGLLLNELVLFIGTGLLDNDYRLSKIFSAGIVFIFNYYCRKLTLFS